jgi:hypothetical protein
MPSCWGAPSWAFRKGKLCGIKARSRATALRIGGNNAIGDAGTVALPVALKMAMGSESGSHGVLEEKDLFSCDVGDAGAEAPLRRIVIA